MSDIEVRAVFVDEVSGPAKNAADNVGDSFGKADESTKSLTQSVEGLAKGFLALISVKAAVDYLKSATQAADVQIVSQVKLIQQLQNTGAASKQTLPGLLNLATGMQKLTLYGDETVMSAESVLLMFGKISGDIFPRTIAVAADLATVMGTDLTSATMQLARALEEPEVGLTLLRRAGITFTKEQTAFIKSLSDSGQAAKAQDYILGVLEDRVGGLAEVVAQQGLGPWKQMLNVFGDVNEEVGAQFIPTLQDLAKWLISIAPMVQEMGSATARFIVVLGNFVAGIAQGVTAGIMTLVSGVSGAIAGMLWLVEAAMRKLPKRFIPEGWLESVSAAQDAVRGFAVDSLGAAALGVESMIDKLKRMADALMNVETATPDMSISPTTVKKRPKRPKTPDEPSIPESPEDLADNLAAMQDIRRQFAQIGMNDRDKELADLNDWYTDQAEALGNNLASQEELYQVYLDKRKEMHETWAAEDIAIEEQHTADMVSAFETMADNIVSTADMFIQAEMNAIEKQRKAEIKSIKDSGKTADEKAKLIAETNKKAEEEQKRMGNIQQGIAIIQAIINTALAISSALTMSPPPLGIAMAIIVGAMGAAQVALIASQSFARGGVVKGAPTGDQNLVRANGGEMFLTQAQQARLLTIAEGQAGTGPTVNNNFSFTIAGDVDESTWADRMRKTREMMYELSFSGGNNY